MRCVTSLVVLVVVGGCGKSKSSEREAEPPKIEHRFQIGVYSEQREDADIPISFKGKVIGTAKTTAPYVAVELDDSVRFSDPNNGRTATLDTTCGKVDAPLSLQYENRAAEDKARADVKSDNMAEPP